MCWKKKLLYAPWFHEGHYVIQGKLKQWKINCCCLSLGYVLSMFLIFWQISGGTFLQKKVLTSKKEKKESIVSRGDWLWNPANIKVENNGAVVYVGSSLTVHNPLFFVHKLCLSKLMPFFCWSESSKWMLLNVVHGQFQKSLLKHITRGFPTIPLWLWSKQTNGMSPFLYERH